MVYENILSSNNSITNPIGIQITKETITLKYLEILYLISSDYPEVDLESFQSTTKKEIIIYMK